MISAINRFYRKVFCRGGYGVHSPFAFDFITTVIEDSCGYYCYDDLSAVRTQLRYNESKIRYSNREYSVKQYLNKYCFSESEDKLLFRLANRFKPKIILVAGSDLGLSPLYLTAYSNSAHCIVFEPEADVAAVSRKYTEKYSSSIELHTSCDFDVKGDIDLIVLGKKLQNSLVAHKSIIYEFEEYLNFVNDETVMVISGINSSKKNRKEWNMVCAHPRASVTFDLYSLGIVFFNPNYHRKAYKNIAL